MEDFNYYAILVAAVVPIIMGFLWYNPKLFGIAWMREAEMTEEKMKRGNMPLIFALSLLFSFLLAMVVMMLSVHQMGAVQLIGGDPAIEDLKPSFQAFMDDYGSNFRTFKHGALHGALAGIMFALPIIAINGMFERKSWKYIFINAGYWTLTLAIMGTIICGWV